MRQVFERAGIASGDLTLHTLRHTALSRMIATGFDDHTVMAISGHSSTRMLERYTHPTDERKVAALSLPRVVTIWSQNDNAADSAASTSEEIAELLGRIGGRQEARTPDLRVANAVMLHDNHYKKAHMVESGTHREHVLLCCGHAPPSVRGSGWYQYGRLSAGGLEVLVDVSRVGEAKGTHQHPGGPHA